MSTINYFEQAEELAVFLRNADVLTITQRSVATTTATGTWTGATSHSLAVTNVKNIRSITVDGVALTYSDDYTVDYDFSDTTIKCKITLVAAQTGDYIITYDYGTDKIFPDFPKTGLTISNFPRIAVDLVSAASVAGGFGNVNENVTTFTVVAYATTTKTVRDILTAVRAAFITAQTSFKTIGKVVKPLSVGPMFVDREQGKDKVYHQNIDFKATFHLEIN